MRTQTVTLTAEDGSQINVNIPTGPSPTPARVEELSAAFDSVKNAEHWKGAIDAEVVVGQPNGLATVFEAIEFYTATVASAKYLGRREDGALRFRVTAPGYWNGPAA